MGQMLAAYQVYKKGKGPAHKDKTNGGFTRGKQPSKFMDLLGDVDEFQGQSKLQRMMNMYSRMRGQR